jgi:gliding motility-associated-like protein
MYRVILLLLLASSTVFSQKQANIWYFGDGAGLDFNTTTPVFLLNGQTDFLLPIAWNESYSSISDSSGALLFYSDGVRVWNKTQNHMLNGNNLLGHRSSSMGCLIVPRPGNSRYFYIFTNDSLENNFQNGLRYSVVDICGDNTKGEVISTAKNVPLYTLTSERLVSVKHSNGSDYWIISHKFNSNEFCAFLLTNAGIVDTVISNIGPIDSDGWGEMAISKNGNKISYCIPTIDTTKTSAFIADFNVVTGAVTNVQILSMGGREYATSFSPDNSKLYFSTAGIGNLFQYDLNSLNLTTLIASKSYLFQNGADQWRHMAHGPDGKIYISRTGKNYLSAIYNPNNLYPNCTYVDTAINLGGKFTSHGLPNFIADFQYSNTITECYHYDSIVQSICQGQSYLGYSSTGIFIDTLIGNNSCDTIRILNLTFLPHSSENLTDTICQGNSYLGYTFTGIYIDTLISSNGCDSIRTLNLTVLPNSSANITQTICQGNLYLGYTSTGTYVDILIGSNGCDSIRTLNLTVLPNSSTNITQTICPGNSYLGYTSTGIYIDTLISSNGCDSIRTLNLTVLPNSSANITQTICQGNSYLGYTSTGIYIDTLISSNGCDSIRTLNLTVIQNSSTNLIQTICQGNSYLGYTATGIYFDTLISSIGCDSIRTLNLTVLTNSSTNLIQTICQGNSYLGYSTTGIYVDTLISSNGCDSIRTLNLTVLPNSSSNLTQIICQGNSYLGYSSTGIYIDTLISGNGCDSIRTLDLKVVPKLYDTIRHKLCPGEKYFSYNQPGIYIDTFINLFGCDSIRILKLELDEYLCCQIFAPNAFTPNRDNMNDEFLIKGTFDEYNIIIVDRWGNILYQSTNSFFGWDGKCKGVEMPIGTYYYLFKYRCNNSEIKMLKGDITLIR